MILPEERGPDEEEEISPEEEGIEAAHQTFKKFLKISEGESDEREAR